MQDTELPPLPTFDEWAYPSRDSPDLEPVGFTIETLQAYGDARARHAVMMEREACAQICEGEKVEAETTGTEGDIAYNHAIEHCAAAIRATNENSAPATEVTRAHESAV